MYTALVLAEEAGHGGVEAPNPILPATNELILGAVSFVILLAAMWKWAFPSIKKTMEARTERIRIDIDSAERAKLEASEVLTQYQQQLSDAKAEANRIIEEAKQSAEAVRRDLMERAEQEAAGLRERNQQEIAAAKESMIVDLRSDVSALAIELAEKVVEKNLDNQTNAALIDQYINQVGAGK